jgi:hypothetical protein
MLDGTYTAYEQNGIEKPFIMLLGAPRKSGKTFLLNKLLVEGGLHKQFDHIVIASPSLEFNDEYPIEDKVSCEVHKISSNFKTRIDALIEEQQHAARMVKHHPDTYEPIHTLIVLDDIIDSKLMQYRSSENVGDTLGERGRHFYVSLIGSAQTTTAFSPSIRRNAEYFFIFSPTNYAESERVLDEYVPNEARKEFRSKLTRMFVQEHSFLMIDNSPEKRTYWKKRFRKGFTELMFPMHPGETEEITLDKSKRKRKRRRDDEGGEEEAKNKKK